VDFLQPKNQLARAVSTADCATASTSSALSAGKGRPSGPVLMMTSSPTLTSKTPLRGLTALTATSRSGSTCPIALATLVARDLNAPHDLHASISIRGNCAVVEVALTWLKCKCTVASSGAGFPVGGDVGALLSRAISSALRPETGRPAARNFSFSCTTVYLERSPPENAIVMRVRLAAEPAAGASGKGR